MPISLLGFILPFKTYRLDFVRLYFSHKGHTFHTASFILFIIGDLGLSFENQEND